MSSVDRKGNLHPARIWPSPRKRPATDHHSSYMTPEKRPYLGTEGMQSMTNIMDLPKEVIRNVFCRLPMEDLLGNVALVCHQWHSVLSDPNFLPWKKQYARVRRNLPTTPITMVKNPEDKLPQLIRHVRNFKPYGQEMDAALKRHHLYGCALAVLQERFADCILEDKNPDPWCMIAMLVVVSEFVSDIQMIYKVLLGTVSCEVLECLYCINTLLLQFKKTSGGPKPWNGLHYRVYYALYLYENERPATDLELQNSYQDPLTYSISLRRPLTNEQMRVCNYEVSQGEVIKVVAFAGTGKTTTLLEYTRMRPNTQFLFVVFNRAVKEQSERTFPKNVTCRTGHSLAYQPKGKAFCERGKLFNFAMRVSDISKHYQPYGSIPKAAQCKFVQDTLNRYMASADPTISIHHVPRKYKRKDKYVDIDQRMQQHVVAQANRYWRKMVNLYDRDAQVTHDTYLKLYQLSKPRIFGYDVILIDEAQDVTPALADILQLQPCAKIYVGDPHQQIYRFRGAINALQNVNASRTFYLTQSFRFGSQVAWAAASCLETLGGERKTLVGNASTGSIRGDESGQLAIVARSNHALFARAVLLCCQGTSPGNVAFVGGIKGLGIEMLLDMYSLLARTLPRPKGSTVFYRKIKNPFINGFGSFALLEKYVNDTEDVELAGKIKIVKTHNHNLPQFIETIEKSCNSSVENADIVFTTAHKSKGLEFDTVELTDDYNIARDSGGQPHAYGDEGHILYVAATRAKKNLIMSSALRQVLDYVGETFSHPVLTSSLGPEKEFECCVSGTTFEPQTVTLVKRASDKKRAFETEDSVVSPLSIMLHYKELKNLFGISLPQPLVCKLVSKSAEQNPTSSQAQSMIYVQQIVDPCLLQPLVPKLVHTFTPQKQAPGIVNLQSVTSSSIQIPSHPPSEVPCPLQPLIPKETSHSLAPLSAQSLAHHQHISKSVVPYVTHSPLLPLPVSNFAQKVPLCPVKPPVAKVWSVSMGMEEEEEEEGTGCSRFYPNFNKRPNWPRRGRRCGYEEKDDEEEEEEEDGGGCFLNPNEFHTRRRTQPMAAFPHDDKRTCALKPQVPKRPVQPVAPSVTTPVVSILPMMISAEHPSQPPPPPPPIPYSFNQPRQNKKWTPPPPVSVLIHGIPLYYLQDN